MAEAVIVTLFLLTLLVLQFKEQKKILIKTKSSKVKLILTIGLAIGLLVIFWPESVADQIKLGAFSILILSIGFFKEGLAENHLVKLGLLSGEYTQYKMIQIEKTNEKDCFVTFYKTKNNHFSLLFDTDERKLVDYFSDLNVPIILGELPEEIVVKKPKKSRNRAKQRIVKSKS
ncbi:hypothetical protein BAU15_11455 [Enterococcus sp. JM4C]|uniref:hypothetical protein n=1 Tax=Candidatus Enterococcus huntleyi TaxID=1857217 RepID=UPI00137A98D3|nr:hypothetical protein [Enterococcus sp. JM4C]KAF1297359.1 hypothetical protein BAU15_11455 [Enterococcus sp. JM4C]